MTAVMVQMSSAVDVTVIPVVIHPVLCPQLQERAVRTISVVLMVGYISNRFVVINWT
jgi:hypothetical protein